jgi:hypothetical protein
MGSHSARPPSTSAVAHSCQSPGGNRAPHRVPGSKRAEVRSAFGQEQEQELRDGPLPRDRGVAALGHRDVRVPGGMYTQRLDPGTLQLPASRYRGVTAYARAKRAQVALSREWAAAARRNRRRLPRHAPRLGGQPEVAAALPGFRRVMRPILLSPERRHDRLAGRRAAGEPGQRPVLARPARPARIPAAVDARDRPQHRTQALGSPGRGDRHGPAQSWRRQGGTAWLLLGHLSAGAGMTEQQPHEVVDRPDGFELRRTWWPESRWAARLIRRPTVRSVRWRGSSTAPAARAARSR